MSFYHIGKGRPLSYIKGLVEVNINFFRIKLDYVKLAVSLTTFL